MSFPRSRESILLLPLLNLPRFTGHLDKSYNKTIGGSNKMDNKKRQFTQEFKKEVVE